MNRDFIKEILLWGSKDGLSYSHYLVAKINNKDLFDQLFLLLTDNDRQVVWRTADVLEKVSRIHPEYLKGREKTLLLLTSGATREVMKWHLAPLLGRAQLNDIQTGETWQLLTDWLVDKREGRIARVNAMHAMFDIVMRDNDYLEPFLQIVELVKDEPIPSLRARLKFIAKAIYKEFGVKL